MTNPSIINHSGAHNQKGQPKESSRSKKELAPAGAGNARTPDKTIGQVKYADGQKAEGSAANLQSPSLEFEKQGGIGGP